MPENLADTYIIVECDEGFCAVSADVWRLRLTPWCRNAPAVRRWLNA